MKAFWSRLSSVSRGKPVHLTVHDDPVSVFHRSTRYRLLYPLMSQSFSRLLKSVRSVDVISHGMRDFYLRKFGVRVVSCVPLC